jgi:hypothetical protein
MGAFLASLPGPPFTLVQSEAGSRKAAKHAKQGSFFCAKKKVVLVFLCVLASLRGPPFHGEATAGSRKAAKYAKEASFFCSKKKGRSCLSLRLGVFA